MAYSTCSFNPIEDEAVVASLLSRYPCAHACSRFQSALLCLLHCFLRLAVRIWRCGLVRSGAGSGGELGAHAGFSPSFSFFSAHFPASPDGPSLTVPFYFIECEGVCETHTRGRRSASSR